MRIVVCDRCRREIPDEARIGYIAVKWKDSGQPNPYDDYDFCESCMREIVTLIDANPCAEPEGDPEEKKAEPEPAAEPETVQEKVKKRKPVNLRELREMVKAGKESKEIAEHFGLSIGQYLQYRSKAEKAYIEGMI